jgi:hypothetical protein
MRFGEHKAAAVLSVAGQLRAASGHQGIPGCLLSQRERGTPVRCRSLTKRPGCGEVTRADHLLGWLTEDILLLWDRNFFRYRNPTQIRQRWGMKAPLEQGTRMVL